MLFCEFGETLICPHVPRTTKYLKKNVSQKNAATIIPDDNLSFSPYPTALRVAFSPRHKHENEGAGVHCAQVHVTQLKAADTIATRDCMQAIASKNQKASKQKRSKCVHEFLGHSIKGPSTAVVWKHENSGKASTEALSCLKENVG